MSKFKSSAETLTHINERLKKPISKQQFRTIYKLMAERGDATPIQLRQSGWVMTENLWQWTVYLSTRENLIAEGIWNTKRPYSLRDMEDVAIGGEYEDYQPE